MYSFQYNGCRRGRRRPISPDCADGNTTIPRPGTGCGNQATAHERCLRSYSAKTRPSRTDLVWLGVASLTGIDEHHPRLLGRTTFVTIEQLTLERGNYECY